MSWLNEIKGQISVSTFQSYKAITRRFLRFLGSNKIDDISTIGLETIQRYRDEIRKDYSTGTVNNHLKMLRLVFEAAAQQDIIDRNPAKLVKNLARIDRQERRPFSIEELRKLLVIVDGDWKTAVLIGVYTGLRFGDVVNMTWGQVDLVRGEITVKTEKTERVVIIPIAAVLARRLEELPATDDPKKSLCPDLAGKRIANLSVKFHDFLARAGLVEKRDYQNHKSDGKRRKYAGLSFHSLRHTATSMLKNAGVSDSVARDIIGHDSEAISRNYTKIDIETKRAAMDRMPDLQSENL